jgi:hypothetical protein
MTFRRLVLTSASLAAFATVFAVASRDGAADPRNDGALGATSAACCDPCPCDPGCCDEPGCCGG